MSRWCRFLRWYWQSDRLHRECLARIERLERELFPWLFPPVARRVRPSNFTQVTRNPFSAVEHRRAFEAAAFGFSPEELEIRPAFKWPVAGAATEGS